MKSILISIRPEWVAKILNGEKTIEIRKTAPKCDLPIDVYIYCTKTIKPLSDYDWGDFTFDDLPKLGKVVAKFMLRKVEEIICRPICGEWESYTKTLGYSEISQASCLENRKIVRYLKGKNGYAWHISDLEIFDEPIPLAALGAESAPQSWVYIESDREPIYARNGRCEAYCDGKLIGGNYFLHITMNGSEIMHQKWAVMPTKADAEEILAALNPEGI